MKVRLRSARSRTPSAFITTRIKEGRELDRHLRDEDLDRSSPPSFEPQWMKVSAVGEVLHLHQIRPFGRYVHKSSAQR